MNIDLDVLRSFAKQVQKEHDRALTTTGGVIDSEGGLVTKVVGVTFENRQPIINVMLEDTEVRLVREPTNKFDSNAIGVEANILGKWFKVGYVPKEDNKEVAVSMDKNMELGAKIVEFNEFFCEEVKNAARGITIVIEGV